ncbi:hypothetical protein HZC30_07055 [Candidatus Woesearchaeota archaeon]|nr:hypothetical protein [Candidatus Woesearchaeota archaeon]
MASDITPIIDYIRLFPSGNFALLKKEKIGCELLMNDREWKNTRGEIVLRYAHKLHQLSWRVDIEKAAEMFKAHGIADKSLDVLIHSEGKNYFFREITMLDFSTHYSQEQPVEELLHTTLILSYLPGKHLEKEI